MVKLISLLFLLLFPFVSNSQSYPSATGNVQIPNNIEWSKHTQKIISGSSIDPKSVATNGGAGSLLMKTDGSLYVKSDAGITTNWKKFLDDTFSVITALGYTPVPNTTTVNGHALSSSVTITKSDVGLGNVPDVDATNPFNITQDATHRFVSDTEKSTWNGKQDAIGFTSENVANKSASITLGSSDTLYPTQNAVKSYVDTALGLKSDDISAITKDVTGFTNPDAVIVSYDTATDRVVLTGDTSCLWRGKAVTSLPSGWVSPPHPVGSGTWFLYYDGDTATTTWSLTPWTFDKLQIAIAYDQSYAHFGLREPHGQMAWLTHKELHETLGSYKSSGGTFSSYVLASTTPANRRPDISSTVINDEDVPTTNSALTTKLYTRFALTGTASTAQFGIDFAEFVPVVGSRPSYNQFTGGTWTQTAMTNGAYQAVFVMALPVDSDSNSQKYRYVFIQGQQESTTLATIQALTPASVNLNGFVSSAPEFVFIGKIIIRYNAGDWTIISVESLTGTKVSQSYSTGNWLSSVSTSSDFSGDGTSGSPLALNTATASAINSLLGTANYIPKFSGSGLSATNMSITASGTGVGTTAPFTNFDVAGTGLSISKSGARRTSCFNIAAVSTATTTQVLGCSGESLILDRQYRIMAWTTGTGAYTGAGVLYTSNGTAWSIKREYETGLLNINSPYFQIVGGIPILGLRGHPSMYTIVYFVEEMDVPTGSNRGNPFGSGIIYKDLDNARVGVNNEAPETSLHVTGDTTMTGTNYLGLSTVDGSYRTRQSAGATIYEKRESGVWVEVYRIE
jgi:hypothetical protein